MTRPIPKHENSRFRLFRDKFVTVELEATAFTRVFFLHKDFKNERAIGYLKIDVFSTTLVYTLTRISGFKLHMDSETSIYCENPDF